MHPGQMSCFNMHTYIVLQVHTLCVAYSICVHKYKMCLGIAQMYCVQCTHSMYTVQPFQHNVVV